MDYEEAVHGGIIRGCLFRDIAGNGLLVGSFSPAAHETHLPYDPADRREVCTHQRIDNCYFTETGNEDWGCLAIAAGYVSDIHIVHNEICEVPYSGISLGWGWTQTVNCMKNNQVHANLIHHYAKHMYDVAGIYTLGSQPKTYVTENCVHSIYKPGYVHDPNHWFYLYTDEGSSLSPSAIIGRKGRSICKMRMDPEMCGRITGREWMRLFVNGQGWKRNIKT